MSWVQNQNPGGGVQGGSARVGPFVRVASRRPPMDLAALWGGAWQQRAEVQRSWAAYYARDRHIGLCRPCALKHPHATCALKRRGRCKLCAWWRRFRVYARWIGYLCVLQQRAAMRVYAPGGVGFHLAQASFEGKV